MEWVRLNATTWQYGNVARIETTNGYHFVQFWTEGRGVEQWDHYNDGWADTMPIEAAMAEVERLVRQYVKYKPDGSGYFSYI